MNERDRALLDLVDHPVFVLEPGADGLPRYVAFNKAALSKTTKTLPDIIGCTAEEVYDSRLGRVAFDQHVDTLRTGTRRTYELLLPLKDGHRLICTTLNPVVAEGGEVTRIVGSSIDITGQQAVREPGADTDRLRAETEEFVTLAAHDLRSPIRNIQSIAQMMREDAADAGLEDTSLLDMLEGVSQRALNLISDVLSHAEAALLVEETVTFELHEMAQSLLEGLDPRRMVTLDCPDLTLDADRMAIQVILRNLMDNAIKHAADTGQDQLHLTLSAAASAEGMLALAIEDDGTGFDDPVLLLVSGRKSRVEGGFGLMGIRRLIHARGGALTVSNKPGGAGARVQFSLPGRVVGSDHMRRTG